MKLTQILAFSVLFFVQDGTSQMTQWVGLPMAGAVSASTANILVLSEYSQKLHVTYWQEGQMDSITQTFTPAHTDTFKRQQLDYYKFQLTGLSASTTYHVHFRLDALKAKPLSTLSFTTSPPKGEIEDFSFLLGSCAAPFKGWLAAFRPANKIFDRMTETESDFMVWMGDNVYYLMKEWNDYQAMVDKNLDYRTNKKISQFLNSRPQLATWDDHDYGPNDSESAFDNKNESFDIFKKFWANDSWGLEGVPGVFGKYSYADTDFFLMDSRFHRKDTIAMFGEGQMNWLKSELKQSKATFKFIVSGTQLLPVAPKAEDFGDYPQEKADFLAFLEQEKIEGVVLLSGDTHYAELTKLPRNGYPLYEMTASALTSPYFAGSATNNPIRVANTLYKKRNFGKISLQGAGSERKCIFELYNNKKELVWRHEVKASDLTFKQ